MYNTIGLEREVFEDYGNGGEDGKADNDFEKMFFGFLNA